MKYPNKIAELRRGAGYSQREMARITGIGRPSLSNLEQGLACPSLVHAFKIASVLKTNIYEIWYDPNQGPVNECPSKRKAAMARAVQVGDAIRILNQLFIEEQGVQAQLRAQREVEVEG